jgi:hypothetical protein
MTGVVRGITLTLMRESGGHLPGACAGSGSDKAKKRRLTRKGRILKPPARRE